MNVCAAQFSTNTVKCAVTISAKWSGEQWPRNKKRHLLFSQVPLEIQRQLKYVNQIIVAD